MKRCSIQNYTIHFIHLADFSGCHLLVSSPNSIFAYHVSKILSFSVFWDILDPQINKIGLGFLKPQDLNYSIFLYWKAISSMHRTPMEGPKFLGCSCFYEEVRTMKGDKYLMAISFLWRLQVNKFLNTVKILGYHCAWFSNIFVHLVTCWKIWGLTRQ